MTCRICAKPRAAMDLKPLQTEILAKVRKILPVVIVDGDPLPHDICYPCETKVTALSDFYDDSLRADMYLRTSLPRAEQKNIPDSNAILNFYASGQFMTAAYKTYVEPCVSMDLSRDFLSLQADTTLVFSCKRCSSNFVTKSGAMRHFCNKERKRKKKKKGEKKDGNGIVDDIICLSGDEEETVVEVDVNKSDCSNGTQGKRKKLLEENDDEKSKQSTKSDVSETKDDSSASNSSSSIVKARKQARLSVKPAETVPG